MKSLTLEFVAVLGTYALFLLGMYWLYRKFNQKVIAEAIAQVERKHNIKISGE